MSHAIQAKVAEINKTIPKEYKLDVNIDFTRSTDAVVRPTHSNSVPALVTVIICFLFLGSFQAALNILFSIPTSIIGTFIVIYFAGFSLNLFTLLALTLAISIVVDDAIMLLENIVRHYRLGKKPAQAAYDGAMEILPAATAATLAVVAVFLPVIFMSGITGKFFFQFGVTLSAAVLLSLVEAVTITPMRAAFLLKKSPKTSRFEHFLDHLFESIGAFYARTLKITLRYSWPVVLASTVVFLLSLLLTRSLKQEFVPPQDQDIVILSASTPTGSTLEVTDEAAKKIEAVLLGNKDVVRILANIGSGGPNAEVNQIFMPLYLSPRETRKKLTWR